MKRRSLIALLTITQICLLAAACRATLHPRRAVPAGTRAGVHKDTITIYRDQYGVPSIRATSFPDAEYGLGYAMAQDNAVAMARSYKMARGRLAEVDGRSALAMDGFIRSIGFEAAAEKKAATLHGLAAAVMTSFCAGANRALAEQRSALPAWVKPFTPVDALSLVQLVNAAFTLLDIRNRILPGTGSNQFALAPGRTADGFPILSADPHLTWTGPLRWYEFARYVRGYDFRGVTIIGVPIGAMGHTDFVAWSMTNDSPLLYTLYVVHTDPRDPNRYDYHGDWRAFEEVPIRLSYVDGGVMKSLTVKARRTAWGPMLPFHPWAVRLSMVGSWSILDESIAMMTAKDAASFRAALRPCGLSMWNIVYADTRGNIGYQYNARVARRDPSFDWREPVDGSDPRTRWGPLWTLDELPHCSNPQSGILVNCNSAPWLTPLGSEIPDRGWPAYVTSYGRTTRYDLLSALLNAHRRITPAEARRFATDTQVPNARQAVAALNLAAGGGPAADIAPALQVLSAWDDRADTTSIGCGLYAYWLREAPDVPALAAKAGRGETWAPAEASAALTALARAADNMRTDHNRLDVPWGAMHFTRRGDRTAPTSGFGYIDYPSFADTEAAVAPNAGPFKSGDITCEMGSSFRMISEMRPGHVRSWTILPYGESDDPANPHYADQMTLFGQGHYKDNHYGVSGARQYAVTTIKLER